MESESIFLLKVCMDKGMKIVNQTFVDNRVTQYIHVSRNNRTDEEIEVAIREYKMYYFLMFPNLSDNMFCIKYKIIN